MLRGNGYKIVDLGVDVSPDKSLKRPGPTGRAIALSALLTTTMVQMKAVVEAVAKAGLGSPWSSEALRHPDYAEQIGASGYAADAASAVEEIGRSSDIDPREARRRQSRIRGPAASPASSGSCPGPR